MAQKMSLPKPFSNVDGRAKLPLALGLPSFLNPKNGSSAAGAHFPPWYSGAGASSPVNQHLTLNRAVPLGVPAGWSSPDVLDAMQKKDELVEIAKSLNTSLAWRNVKGQQDVVGNLINNAKQPFQSKVGTENLNCDTCDRGFSTQEDFLSHMAMHVKCNIGNCPFQAHPKVVALHKKMQHATRLAEKIMGLDKPEDIKKWREDRKRNYPTTANVERKRKEMEEKKARGEVLENKFFGKMRKRQGGPQAQDPQNCELKDREQNGTQGRGKRRNRKRHRQRGKRATDQEAPLGNGEAESMRKNQPQNISKCVLPVEPVDEDCNGNLKRFKGTLYCYDDEPERVLTTTSVPSHLNCESETLRNCSSPVNHCDQGTPSNNQKIEMLQAAKINKMTENKMVKPAGIDSRVTAPNSIELNNVNECFFEKEIIVIRDKSDITRNLVSEVKTNSLRPNEKTFGDECEIVNLVNGKPNALSLLEENSTNNKCEIVNLVDSKPNSKRPSKEDTVSGECEIVNSVNSKPNALEIPNDKGSSEDCEIVKTVPGKPAVIQLSEEDIIMDESECVKEVKKSDKQLDLSHECEVTSKGTVTEISGKVSDLEDGELADSDVEEMDKSKSVDPLHFFMASTQDDSDEERRKKSKDPLKQSSSALTVNGSLSLLAAYGSDSEDSSEDAKEGNARPSRPIPDLYPTHPKQRFSRKRLSLLEKLLANEMRQERNVILQCVHHTVKRNFFEANK